jgi:hypothetical protein
VIALLEPMFTNGREAFISSTSLMRPASPIVRRVPVVVGDLRKPGFPLGGELPSHKARTRLTHPVCQENAALGTFLHGPEGISLKHQSGPN